MKTTYNNSDFEKQLYTAIENEKEMNLQSNRVDIIMDRVTELSLQASFETQRLTLKTAFIYGVSIAASVSIGCIIGNLYEISNAAGSISDSVGVDIMSVGFGAFFLPF